MLPLLSHRFEDHVMSQPLQLPDVPTRGLFSLANQDRSRLQLKY